jgi:hypothetical protein
MYSINQLISIMEMQCVVLLEIKGKVVPLLN